MTAPDAKPDAIRVQYGESGEASPQRRGPRLIVD